MDDGDVTIMRILLWRINALCRSRHHEEPAAQLCLDLYVLAGPRTTTWSGHRCRFSLPQRRERAPLVSDAPGRNILGKIQSLRLGAFIYFSSAKVDCWGNRYYFWKWLAWTPYLPRVGRVIWG